MKIIKWYPNPRQELALQRVEFEVLYGGARGGGKTDCGLAWLTEYLENPKFRGLVIRKNADDLSDWIDRASRMYSGIGVRIAYRPAILTFPSGAIIRTGHLKDDQAYTKYQGHEYHRMLIEELTQIPDEKRYLQLVASCRSTISELKPQVFLTTNPGGLGHHWVKERFVDVGIPMEPHTTADDMTRIFIPATIDDNPILIEKDPRYVKMLDSLRSSDEELWKAWRLGSWDTFAGQFFREFRRDLHTIRAFIPRASVPIHVGMDWGYTASFVCLAMVMIEEKTQDGVAFNRVIVFREIDGVEKKPEEWARIIEKHIPMEQVEYIMADPAMFHKVQDGSISIADQFKTVWIDNGYKLKPANNDRLGGAAILHKWLSIAPDGLPYLLISESCENLIKTLPQLIHDEHNVEDVDGGNIDHHYDALRYSLMHLKWIDANVGAASSALKSNKYPAAPHVVNGKILGIDLDAFAKPVKKRSWK